MSPHRRNFYLLIDSFFFFFCAIYRFNCAETYTLLFFVLINKTDILGQKWKGYLNRLSFANITMDSHCRLSALEPELYCASTANDPVC